MKPEDIFLQDVHDAALRHAVELVAEIERLLEMSHRARVARGRLFTLDESLEFARGCRNTLKHYASPEVKEAINASQG
jgi:hypothetical protein